MLRKSMALLLLSGPYSFGAFPEICEKCWYEVPNSNLSSVYQTPAPPPWGDYEAIMDASNGAAYDQKNNRLLIAGHGSGSVYAGNEVYAFDLDSLKWFRIKDAASEYDEADTLYAYYKNGGFVPDSQQPRPGSSYDQLEYDSTTNSLYILGVPFSYSHRYAYQNIHRLQLDSLTWSHPNDVSSDISYGGSVSARDPATGKIWIFGNGSGAFMSSISPSTGSIADHGNYYFFDEFSQGHTGAIMASTNRFISVGGGEAFYWDLVTSGDSPREDLVTTGCDSLIDSYGPGLEWSSVDRKLIAWTGGSHVITMDSTYTCAEVSAGPGNTVTPDAPQLHGTFGRWRYIPKYNVFIVVNETTGSVYLYRHSAAPGGQVVEITSPADNYLTSQDTIPVTWKANGLVQSSQTAEVLAVEGANLVVRCLGGDCDSITVFRDQTAPVVVITSPATGTITGGTTALVKWTQDAVADSLAYNLVLGTQQISVTFTDAAGNVGADTISITRGTYISGSPIFPTGASLSASNIKSTSMTLAWTAATADMGVKEYLIFGNKALLATVPGDKTTRSMVGLHFNTVYEFRVEAVDSLGQKSINGPVRSFSTANDLPPHPATVASNITPSKPTSLANSVAFLYQHSDAIQTGVVDSLMDPVRAAVLRGVVRSRTGSVLSGVTVSIQGHPEFGSTLTRTTGEFDMVVNGSGHMMVDFGAPGYLPIQRQIQPGWQEFTIMDTVVLIGLDSVVTIVDMSPSQPMQVVRSSVVTDTDGTRQATLLIPTNTEVTLLMPDGQEIPLDSMNVRATEYTVGDHGLASMPGNLPSTSAYTYAVEYSIDENLEFQGQIQFNQPIYSYVENFVDIPVGWAVPSAYFDRKKGHWIPSTDGRVIRIHSISGGVANLVVDTSGTLANSASLAALGITTEERGNLASLYSVNQTLWRVPVQHFTPYDFNYGTTTFPEAKPPKVKKKKKKESEDEEEECGSIIGCQSQTLGESFPITGTPFRMHYRSDRVEGRKTAYTFRIPISDSVLPEGVLDIKLEIFIAGRSWSHHFSPDTNLSFTFEWDGLDAYGRVLQGKQPLTYEIGYGYQAYYLRPPEYVSSFGSIRRIANDSLIASRTPEYEVVAYHTYLGTWNSRGQNLGGWSVDVNHIYDITDKTLYFGDGRLRSSRDFKVKKYINTVSGTGQAGFSGDGGHATDAQVYYPHSLDVGPDGSLYFCDVANYRIRKVDQAGIISTVAGNGTQGNSGDGGPATDAAIKPSAVDVGPDGSIYITDTDNSRIRKVDTEGIITTVAGTGPSGFSGDGGLATSAQLRFPSGVVASADGSLYIADTHNFRVRKVGPDGIIQTVAGRGFYNFNGDSIPALQAQFLPENLDLDRHGNLYVADYYNNKLFKVSPDGIFTTVAGTGYEESSGDGGEAILAGIDPRDVQIANDGEDEAIYVVDYFNDGIVTKASIRKINSQGIISTVAGGSEGEFEYLDGRAPTSVAFDDLSGIAIGGDGALYFVGNSNEHKIRSIQSFLPKFRNEPFTIASESGHEVYAFNAEGRHLRTRNGLTGGTLLSFKYDVEGRLEKIVDGDGNETEFVRNNTGDLEKIISPYGQETLFDLNDSGYVVRVTNPAGEKQEFGYLDNGLLTEYVTPRGHSYEFTYDSLGRLIRDDDPAGGFKELDVVDTENGTLSTLVTAMGRVKTSLMETLSTGSAKKVDINPAGLTTETVFGTNGLVTITHPDSTITKVFQGPDPRFGMQSAIPESTVVTLPSGLTFKKTRKSNGVFSNSNDPLTLQSLADTIVVNGKMSTVVYDSATGTTVSISQEGRTWTRKTDSLGRVIGMSTEGLDSVKYSYDERGRLETVSSGIGPSARLRSYEYDANGQLSRLTDEMERIFEFDYDAAGRGTRVLLPDSQEVQFSYDSSGSVASITPPGKSAHAFVSTALDLDSAYSPPGLDSGIWSTLVEHNLDRQLEQISRPDSTQIVYSYDSAGRLAEVQIPGGTYRYSYHAVTGKIDSLFSRDSVISVFEYDGPLLTRETWSGPVSGILEFGYNADFQTAALSVNDSLITFEYDNDGLLVQADNLTLNYHPQNGLLSGLVVDGIEDTLTYNGFGEVIRQKTQNEDSLLYSAYFQRDKLGRITRKEERVGATTTIYEYEYDLRGRLTEVHVDSMMYSRYQYDGNSNRMARMLPSDTLSGIYDGQDRLMQYGSIGFTYNKNGDLTRLVSNGDTTRYSYDVFGNLVSVQLPSGPLVEYIIDGQNRRVGKKVNGALVKGFLYQNQLNPVAEMDGAGNVVARFVYGSKGNVPDLVIKQGIAYRIVSDHLGSPRVVINTASGAVVQRMNHDEFGNLLEDSNPGFQPFGFAGGIHDTHTSLVRFGARDYFPWIGRWTTKDPIGFIDGVNLFSYVGSDPVNYFDPKGTESIPSIMIKIAVVGYAVKKGWDFYKGWDDFDKKASDYQQKRKAAAEDLMNPEKQKEACEAAQELPAAIFDATKNTPGTSMTGPGPLSKPRNSGK